MLRSHACLHRQYNPTYSHTKYFRHHGKLLIGLIWGIPEISKKASPAEKLRYYRELRLLSQEQLGQKFGQSRHYINNFEKGFNPIYYNDACRLGDILAVDPEVFLDEYTRFCMPGYGSRIRKIRSAYDLSQSAFARRLGINRCTEGLWEVEYQNHHPKRKMYYKLMKLAADKGVDFYDA
ncbi:MAG: hypothetical protein IJ242_10070 [Clostridia bacterium]|nr:hypothetical protein [Clostridia bacterium]